MCIPLFCLKSPDSEMINPTKKLDRYSKKDTRNDWFQVPRSEKNPCLSAARRMASAYAFVLGTECWWMICAAQYIECT